MSVTRTLVAELHVGLAPICKAMGWVRADIWRRYGALNNVGKSNQDIRAEIVEAKYYTDLFVDGTIRNETTKDIVNDILTYKAAAKALVRKAVFKRKVDKPEQRQLYTLLLQDKWLESSFLHRQMRKHFKHGKSRVANQFIVRSDKHREQVIDGCLRVTILVAKKYGEDITLVTTTSGKNVNLVGRNLRVIVKSDHVEIHYATEKAAGRVCGSEIIGVDKGYTEAFVDSEGEVHGAGFGAVLTAFSDKASRTGKYRNKLHALEKKHRAAGRQAKADRIRHNNLGCKKIEARKLRARQHLRTIAFQAAHSIVDKACEVVSEDLTEPIKNKYQWKRFNRRMSAWAKNVLAESLEAVCTQRKASNTLVCSAYTSQMDSFTGLLEGKRVGDKFHRINGDVIQSDYNAARNVKDRRDDPEISRFTPYREVRRILLSRSPAQLSVNRLELGGTAASTKCG